jgi:hypothetical protein
MPTTTVKCPKKHHKEQEIYLICPIPGCNQGPENGPQRVRADRNLEGAWGALARHIGGDAPKGHEKQDPKVILCLVHEAKLKCEICPHEWNQPKT